MCSQSDIRVLCTLAEKYGVNFIICLFRQHAGIEFKLKNNNLPFLPKYKCKRCCPLICMKVGKHLFGIPLLRQLMCVCRGMGTKSKCMVPKRSYGFGENRQSTRFLVGNGYRSSSGEVQCSNKW